MGRDITFFREEYFKEEDDEDSYEKRRITSVSLGSGDAWPCYFRPLLVGAYKRVASSNSFSEEKKAAILRSILSCCPPSHEKTNNNNMRCGYVHRSVDNMSFFCNRQNMINESALFDETVQLRLHEAGMWSIMELVLMHNRMSLTTPTIRRVSEMMELVRDFIPTNKEDLKGTPYGDVDDSYNLGDERSIELADAFKQAAAENNVYALIE